MRRTCQNQICSPLVVNQEKNVDAMRLGLPPSFYNKVLGILDEKMSPKPQDTFESAASQMLTLKQYVA